MIVISNRDAHFLNLQGAHHLRRDNNESLLEVKSQYYRDDKDDYDDIHINGDDDDVRDEEYENNKYEDYYNDDDKTNDINDGIGDYSDNSSG